MRNGSRVGLWLAIAALMVGWVGVESTAAAAHPRPRLSISVLSGRADLVSGGDALVRIGGVSADGGLPIVAVPAKRPAKQTGPEEDNPHEF